MSQGRRVDGVRVASCLLAGGCLATASPLPRLWVIATSAALSGLCASLMRVSPPLPASSRLDRLAPWATLVFFAPLFTQAVAPGADMAMHASLARALAAGSDALSPAWGDVHIDAYPRGFSAWLALTGQWLGLGRASIVVSACAYAMYYFGLRGFLRDVLGLPYSNLLAAFLVLGSRTPQSFYGWGGAPTALAIGFGLVAAAELARALAATRGSELIASALVAAWLLSGAMWTHPIGGSIAAVFSCSGVGVRGFTTPRRALGIAALAFLPLLPTLLWLHWHGPQVSPREVAWIRHWQYDTENVLGNWPRWSFPLGVFRAIATKVGPIVSVAFVLSCVVQWRSALGRRRVLYALAALELLAVVLAYGPQLPGLGFLVYPGRIMPLSVPALAVPIAWAFASEHGTTARALGALALSSALIYHVAVYQRALPIATDNDLRVMACLERTAPEHAVVDGAYGDATQWLPALTGRPVTHPHVHCTLFDETDAELLERRPSYRFVGERLRYGDPIAEPLPSSAPVCQAGHAALYRLVDSPSRSQR